jgi:hypothetical protein
VYALFTAWKQEDERSPGGASRLEKKAVQRSGGRWPREKSARFSFTRGSREDERFLYFSLANDP